MRVCGLTAAWLVVCALAHAQEGSPVNVSEGPPGIGWSSLLFYTGTNLEYVCSARSQQATFAWRRADSTITNITDAANTSTVTTSTAHGLAVGNLITISGATGDTDLNGTYYIQTVGASTTFTITTASVGDVAYTESTLVVTTTAPRSSADIWSISKLTYDGSDNLIRKQWAGGSPGFRAICDNRATSTGATKVTYQ